MVLPRQNDLLRRRPSEGRRLDSAFLCFLPYRLSEFGAGRGRADRQPGGILERAVAQVRTAVAAGTAARGDGLLLPDGVGYHRAVADRMGQARPLSDQRIYGCPACALRPICGAVGWFVVGDRLQT